MEKRKYRGLKIVLTLILIVSIGVVAADKYQNKTYKENKPSVFWTIKGWLSEDNNQDVEDSVTSELFYKNGFNVTIPETIKYYNLTENQEKIYILMCEAVANQAKEVYFNSDVNEQDLFVAYDILFNTLYYDSGLQNEYTYSEDRNGNIVKVDMSYYIDKEESVKRNNELREVVVQVKKKVNALNTDFEKVKYIHDYIVNACVYTNTEVPYEYTAYGALIMQKAVCSGYAQAFSLLSNECGIECFSITGHSKINGEPHRWNMVKCDGDWYHLDATWDDKEDSYNYQYFNVTDKVISIDHQIDFSSQQNADLPVSSSMKDNYYFRNGTYVCEASEADTIMQNAFIYAINNKKNVAEIMFANESLAEEIVPLYLSKDYMTKRLQGICNKAAKQLGLNYITPVSRSEDGLFFQITFNYG